MDRSILPILALLVLFVMLLWLLVFGLSLVPAHPRDPLTIQSMPME